MTKSPRCRAERHMRGLACQEQGRYYGAHRCLPRTSVVDCRGSPPMRARLCQALLPLIAAILVIAAGAQAADQPSLIPLKAFFANPSASWEYRVSPDGARIAWIAMREGRATLHFRRLEESSARAVETPRELRAPWPGVESFGWSRDGKRLLFVMDGNGDENAHVFAVDVEAAEPIARDLT